MMRWLLLCLLFVAAPACAVQDCVPGLYGKTYGAQPYWWGRTDAGWYIHGNCQRDDGTVSTWGFVCVHASAPNAPPQYTCDFQRLDDAIIAVGAAADRVAEAKSQLAKLGAPINCRSNAPAGLERICSQVVTSIDANAPAAPPAVTPPPSPSPPPAPSGWIVAATTICAAVDKDATGKCIRRQSFTWDGATRGTVAQSERAEIGRPCTTTFGVSPYFGFDTLRTDRVVACVKQ